MDPLEFDNISSAAIYIAAIAAAVIGMTYIEATYGLGRGILTGLCSIFIMLCVYLVVRRNVR